MIDVPGVPTSGTGGQAGGCLRQFLGDAMMIKGGRGGRHWHWHCFIDALETLLRVVR